MKEYEIRPEALFNRYLELSAEDAENCFNGETRQDIICVGCGGTKTKHQFNKNGFAFVQCVDCSTLFQSPRPPMEAYEVFCRGSNSSRYWAEVFLPAVAEIRREKICRPRAEKLIDLCAEKGVNVECLIDVGAGFGILLDEWRQRYPHQGCGLGQHHMDSATIFEHPIHVYRFNLL